MEFRLLGPFEAWHGDRRIDIGHARQCSVLAVLLVEAGQVVPAAALLDRVWGHEPPDGGLNVLYTYIARLRTALAPLAVALPRGSGGYRLDIDPETVDLHRFRRLASEGLIDEALALWRGTPFTGAASRWLDEVRTVLEQQRLAAVLDRNEGYLRHGRHTELIDAMPAMLAAHPGDERLAGQLMIGLYRSGRAAAALEQYRLARQRLADLFGTEPGPDLHRLQQRILRGDPNLLGSGSPAALPTPTALPTPAALPHDVAGFVGRHEELALLDKLVPPAGARRTVVIAAVHGTAGVGKTALAVHWAQRARPRFPDGCLYADLRGYGPGPPADPGQVLEGFLAVLDVASGRVPTGLDARATLYRSLLAGRRMLVVLDNAASAEQVRPLLPGSPDCMVVITSRSTLRGLAARDRAQTVSLDVLPLDEAVGLLAEFVGIDRCAGEPGAARELAELCARLPVALCVAGGRAAASPGTGLAALVTQLRAASSRLDLLDAGGDLHTAVRSVFSWSFAHLAPPAARLFRLLGLHPGPDLDGQAAAVLAGEPADRLLEALVNAHLVAPAAPDRYRMHDLLREYATEEAAREPSGAAALDRLLDFCLAGAVSCVDILFPHGRHRRPRVDAVPDVPPPVAGDDRAGAQAWLDAERTNLLAVAGCAAADRQPGYAGTLAQILRTYLHQGGHYADALALHGIATRAARTQGDPLGEAVAAHSTGQIYQAMGRNDEAQEAYERALATFTAAGERRLEASALFQLGTLERERGRYPQAFAHLDLAIAIFRELADRLGEGNALAALGEAWARAGEYEVASAHLRRAGAIYRGIGFRQGGGVILGALGDTHLWWGRYDEARDHYERALVILREIGDRRMQARTLNGLAEVRLHLDEETAATYRAALDLAREVGALEEEARALDGIAASLHRAGRDREAREHWQQALAIYDGHGFAQADAVRRRLAELPHR